MKFETIEVSGWKGALWGLRLPMSKDLDDAKSKSDSKLCDVRDCRPEKCAGCSCYENARCKYNTTKEYFNVEIKYCIGKDDLRIAQNLIKADEKKSGGQPNSKFLRMIHVQVGITAPMYFWSELDTYKVGTVANSTSKMHKLSSYPINKDCFEMDDFEQLCVSYKDGSYVAYLQDYWDSLVDFLEHLRIHYNETKDKKYWKELIRLLPESWLQTRVFDCNYEVLRNICCWRENHKLNEWSGKDNPTLNNFIAWARTLPYADELIFYKGENN